MFAIDVAAYAVMSNHYHVVVRVDSARAGAWSRNEVLQRWTRLFDGPVAVQRLVAGKGQTLDEATELAGDAWAQIYRARLCDLSWFMRILNETVARQANAEDAVTGRFWEGRFKSQALLDERAVLTAMAYVDLNPIRAAMAETLETSAYTSVAERLGQYVADTAPGVIEHKGSAADGTTRKRPSTRLPNLKRESHLAALPRQPLLPFDATGALATAIPFAFHDYLELVEATGRCVRQDKRGAISDHTPPLLARLGIAPDQFIEGATRLLQQFGSAVGAPARLLELCAKKQLKYLRGMQLKKAGAAQSSG